MPKPQRRASGGFGRSRQYGRPVQQERGRKHGPDFADRRGRRRPGRWSGGGQLAPGGIRWGDLPRDRGGPAALSASSALQGLPRRPATGWIASCFAPRRSTARARSSWSPARRLRPSTPVRTGSSSPPAVPSIMTASSSPPAAGCGGWTGCRARTSKACSIFVPSKIPIGSGPRWRAPSASRWWAAAISGSKWPRSRFEAGLAVTVVEVLPRLLSRVATRRAGRVLHRPSPAPGRWISGSAQGVTRFQGGPDGAVRSVALSGGGEVPADLVVAGHRDRAGDGPCPCRGNQMRQRDRGRFGMPDLGAGRVLRPATARAIPTRSSGAGCAWNRSRTRWSRGRVAAATMLGQDRAYESEPWFWSDQHGVRLQMAGLSEGADRMVTPRRTGRRVVHHLSSPRRGC